MESGLKIIPITSETLELTKSLPFIHNAPFDRLLIAQAKNENMTLITKDNFIPKYDVKTIW
jgi:PIN domain nuclease of toxin-antitoxin system